MDSERPGRCRCSPRRGRDRPVQRERRDELVSAASVPRDPVSSLFSSSLNRRETIYDERPEIYFPLLRLLTTHHQALPTNASAQDVLEQALSLIESHALLPLPSEQSTFNLGLALHAAAPRVEAAFASYASVDEASLGVAGCDAWVEWRGKGFCDVDDLRRDIELSIDDETHVA